MNKNKVMSDLLKTIPGAKKAALGIIFPLVNGRFPEKINIGTNGKVCLTGEFVRDHYHLRNIFFESEIKGFGDEEILYFEFCSRKEVLRLRSLKGPHDYLLRLRCEAIADSPRALRVFAHRREIFEKKGKKWSLNQYYHSKDMFHKLYLSKLKPGELCKVKHIPSGLALVPEINAICIRSIVGDVVLVSEGLEIFYYYMTIAFYGLNFGFDPTDVRDALVIAVRIIIGSETLDFDIDPRGSIPKDMDRRIKEYVGWQMQFTFGHEYSHIIRGHLGDVEVIKLKSNGSDELYVYNHELEYEADYYAVKNVEHDKDFFQKISHGAFSVLIYLHFAEEVLLLLKLKKPSVSNTHPKAIDRIIRLHSNIGDSSPFKISDIDEMIASSEFNSKVMKIQRDHSGEELFLAYGSYFMSNYVNKLKVDRFDV